MWMSTEGKILVIKDLLESIPGSQGQASTTLLKLSNGFEGSFYQSSLLHRHSAKVLMS